MNWNKVNLKSKEKNLPPIGESVLWATNKKQTMDGKFLKFIGYLSEDRTIETGLTCYKLTSNFWWMEITDPEIY